MEIADGVAGLHGSDDAIGFEARDIRRPQDLGSIAVGKRADLSGFSVDLMTAPEAEIPKGHAVLTVVDGQVVYQHR